MRSRQLRRAQNLWLYARVFVMAAIAPQLFRVRLSVVHALLSASGRRTKPDRAKAARVIAYVRIAQKTGGPMVRTGCLTRATTLFFFLRRGSQDLSLCFGAGFPKGVFASHCWLELNGKPYLERHDPRPEFNEIFRIPHRRTTGLVQPNPIVRALIS